MTHAYVCNAVLPQLYICIQSRRVLYAGWNMLFVWNKPSPIQTAISAPSVDIDARTCGDRDTSGESSLCLLATQQHPALPARDESIVIAQSLQSLDSSHCCTSHIVFISKRRVSRFLVFSNLGKTALSTAANGSQHSSKANLLRPSPMPKSSWYNVRHHT